MLFILANKKAQVWYTDFIVGVLIFVLILFIFYDFFPNIIKSEEGQLDDILMDAKEMSYSLLSAGYPVNWNEGNIVRLGLTDNNFRVNKTKAQNLLNMTFEKIRRVFKTPYKFYFYFEDTSNNIILTDGKCGFGHSDILDFSSVENMKVAYIFRENSHNFLEKMRELAVELNITLVEFNITPLYSMNDFVTTDLPSYTNLVFEDPQFGAAEESIVDTYLKENSTKTFISGRLRAATPVDFIGVKYSYGECTGIDNITIIHKAQLLEFSSGDLIIPSSYCPHINGSINRIGLYGPSENNAIAKWSYGNSTLYYFNSFNNSYQNNISLYQERVKEAFQANIYDCHSIISSDHVSAKYMVAVTRFVIYQSRLAKLVIFAWY